MSETSAKKTVGDAAAAQLRARVDGAVTLPGDAGYDEARMAWNLAVDQRPAAVVDRSRWGSVV